MDAGRANRKKFKKRQQRDIKEQAEKAAGQEVEEKAPNWRERMDRLEKLAKEKEGYVGNMSPVLPTNFVIPERYQEFIEYENTMLNWLDGQIRQSVAQEIFDELEEKFGLYTEYEGKLELSKIVINPGDYYSTEDALERYHAIKSKWGIRDE